MKLSPRGSTTTRFIFTMIMELVLSSTLAPFNVSVTSPRPGRRRGKRCFASFKYWNGLIGVPFALWISVKVRLDPIRIAGVADEADPAALAHVVVVMSRGVRSGTLVRHVVLGARDRCSGGCVTLQTIPLPCCAGRECSLNGAARSTTSTHPGSKATAGRWTHRHVVPLQHPAWAGVVPVVDVADVADDGGTADVRHGGGVRGPREDLIKRRRRTPGRRPVYSWP